MMNELLSTIAEQVEISSKDNCDIRAYTDKDGKMWLRASLYNRYEKHNAIVLYDPAKPVQYYVNALLAEFAKV